MNQIPNEGRSLWQIDKQIAAYQPLDKDMIIDVVVVGGGITGLLSAYLLAKEGKRVAVLEADRLLEGTTGYTTAKISSQHGPIYHELMEIHGEEKAKLYYEANEEALNFLRTIVEKEGIDCGLITEDAYVYTTNNKNVEVLEKEEQAYQTLGIDGRDATEEVELPYPVKKALVLRNQAQFDPVKFAEGLLPVIEANGGCIFEQTRVTSVRGIDEPTVTTENGHKLKCQDVIIASHFPFNDEQGAYFSRLHAQRSYSIAVQPAKNPPKGMYLAVDSPSRSLRHATDTNGDPLLLIGGQEHTAGKNRGDTFANYEQLMKYGEKNFGVNSIPYRWSAQDLVTLDKVPYIGQMTSGKKHVWVATGFAKWGMSNGVVAALLLKDLILENENRFASLFDPRRSEIKKGATSFVKENVDVAKELVKGKAHRENKTVEELGLDEGSIVVHHGKKAGAYRDKEGQLHVIKPTCTHMGCDVEWNNAERSWDCPCHGSRFSHTGSVIEGPAVKPLKSMKEK
ncbi:FAD-dependent oxidoreductase [Oceanobacillus manasiensis]|uniref:FAD-dependent oxidoreductase n=1 Tax=Oceanobacillus manasiensis TaxID=586413 RepID=UPI0005A938B4|nr:FAD-dependent oxidoreductase [Oceanobacillus manasiensis]